ncbi:MAG: sigma-70 family RNA polymerase sigma factor [Candidatus Eisenbacteria bacterium]|uniref:Sigma-70 family RNA polymerase sigma factor n=1 Tax=Eiseniibacteriota bacterium TaxID=2212470 RepID=A0A948RSX8_UNCEI|nr:sigma-70 family RNA polymerase sigma factor [Candidatus Eisenbacteria bacterium]MBU1949350.1 sigma-70 family RNA polymerase sigma factor [Candidatus Eisenbacteria bacterium]MBU2690423.1 sigma-70 family RNA polymerase sigma factor [Candidatus Eisenbacteria bacterium]
MALENENAVIRRCQRGEIDAFETIYHYYEEQLMAVAFRLLSNREEAEEALHDAMFKAYRKIGQFRHQASFSSWLHRIVINICYDRLRKMKRRGAQKPLEELGEIGREDNMELRRRLHEAIAGLPPKMKTCFVLFVQQGYKQQEIADMLDIKLGTVKLHVYEARTRLRETLADQM